jgi:uncharacterized membrane-anchored protein
MGDFIIFGAGFLIFLTHLLIFYRIYYYIPSLKKIKIKIITIIIINLRYFYKKKEKIYSIIFTTNILYFENEEYHFNM